MSGCEVVDDAYDLANLAAKVIQVVLERRNAFVLSKYRSDPFPLTHSLGVSLLDLFIEVVDGGFDWER